MCDFIQVNDNAVFTLYNPLYNRLHRVCALLYVAAQCIDVPTARMLFAVLFAGNQVMQSMLVVVTDVDVSSCHVAEEGLVLGRSTVLYSSLYKHTRLQNN